MSNEVALDTIYQFGVSLEDNNSDNVQCVLRLLVDKDSVSTNENHATLVLYSGVLPLLIKHLPSLDGDNLLYTLHLINDITKDHHRYRILFLGFGLFNQIITTLRKQEFDSQDNQSVRTVLLALKIWHTLLDEGGGSKRVGFVTGEYFTFKVMGEGACSIIVEIIMIFVKSLISRLIEEANEHSSLSSVVEMEMEITIVDLACDLMHKLCEGASPLETRRSVGFLLCDALCNSADEALEVVQTMKHYDDDHNSLNYSVDKATMSASRHSVPSVLASRPWLISLVCVVSLLGRKVNSIEKSSSNNEDTIAIGTHITADDASIDSLQGQASSSVHTVRVSVIDILLHLAQNGFEAHATHASSCCRTSWYDRDLWYILIRRPCGVGVDNLNDSINLMKGIDGKKITVKSRLVIVCAKPSCTLSHINRLLYLGAPKTDLRSSQNYLMDACRQGDSCRVQLLTAAGIDVKSANKDGSTALMHACSSGHIECVRCLLIAGSALDARAADGWSAVMFATYSGHAACLDLLLNQGADVDARKEDGITLLIRACLMGHHDCVNTLLQHGACMNEQECHGGFTAAMKASENGHWKCLKSIINHGCDIDITNAKGETALILASKNGHKECIDVILLSSYDKAAQRMEARDLDGNTPLLHACRVGQGRAVTTLLQFGADRNAVNFERNSALIQGILISNIQIVQSLLDTSVALEWQNDIGCTALMYASRNGSVRIVKKLLECGADIEAKSHSGWTSLHFASKSGHADCVAVLLAAGASLNNKTVDGGHTALMWASSLGRADCAKVLVAAGADIWIEDDEGNTAYSKCFIEEVRYILRAGDRSKFRKSENKTLWSKN